VSKIRVVIADDHQLLREGIRALLSLSADIEVVGEAADGRAAVDTCVNLDPDLVLMDIAMPGLGGLEATLELKREHPRTKILVLTQYEDREYVRRFLKAGVSGFVLKKAAGAALAEAIQGAANGGLVLDPAVAQAAFDEAGRPASGQADPYETLTDREKQVFKLVAEGKSNKEVASMLEISQKTVEAHRANIMHKLNLASFSDLVHYAIRNKIVEV